MVQDIDSSRGCGGTSPTYISAKDARKKFDIANSPDIVINTCVRTISEIIKSKCSYRDSVWIDEHSNGLHPLWYKYTKDICDKLKELGFIVKSRVPFRSEAFPSDKNSANGWRIEISW